MDILRYFNDSNKLVCAMCSGTKVLEAAGVLEGKTVTAVYDDGSTETVPAEDYTLSGTLSTGISTITASYQGKTATFQVTVAAAPMAFPVTNNLTGCSTSNSAAAVMENEPYSAVITPASGYTLTGASVVITMAGSNITASAYSNGVINIARVTGALVISVAAVEIVLSSISAVYTQSGTVYDTDTLDSLKTDLVVTAAYSDGTSTALAADAYTLSGTLTAGTSTITVSYQGKSTTFQVTVTAAPQVYLVTNELTGCTTDNSAASVAEGSSYAARITANSGYTLVGAVVTITMSGQDITASAYSGGVISIPAVTGALVISVAAVAVVLSSISAVYTQSGTVYDTDTLESLKDDLVVTAHYSDSSTQTVPAADYTLSGALAVGTSTITVTYQGKTTTFSVTVSEAPLLPAEYQQVEYIKATGTQHIYTNIQCNDGAKSSGDNNIKEYSADIDFQWDEWQSSYATNIVFSCGSSGGNWIGYANGVTNIAMGISSGQYFTDSEKSNRHQFHWSWSGTTATFTRDDGASISRANTATSQIERGFTLFYADSNSTSNYHFNGKVFSCKVYKNDVKVLDLIPCYRKADGVIGMYDTVNEVFYTNNGSGTFEKGADVA